MIGFYNYTVILTYMGAASAVLGMCFAMQQNVPSAMMCLLIAGLCDMFDGTVAKTRKRTAQEKRFGIQIDSLADLTCFGVLPAIMGYQIGLNNKVWHYGVLACYVLAALIRLAYFNVMEEERQQCTNEPRTYYEGLPVTTVAALLPLIYCFSPCLGAKFYMVYGVALAIIAFLFILKFRLVKLKMRGMLVLLAIGTVEFIWFIKEFIV